MERLFCCWCQNKAKAMLFVDARFVTWICWSCQICCLDLLLHEFVKVVLCISLTKSNLLIGFVDIVTWICQSCFMYFSQPNQTRLKFNQDFKVFWGFCFELKVLIESRTHNDLGPLCLWQCFCLFFKLLLFAFLPWKYWSLSNNKK